jgi:hypothetical protein
MTDWTDRLAGARMQVDQQFQDRVMNSQFSNQQWGLIMTAVEWDIRQPDDPEAAQLVADTSHLEDIMPELDRVQEQVAGATSPREGGGPGGGLIGQLTEFLGSLTDAGGSDTDDQLREAKSLVQDYARELQTFLEDRGSWEDIRESAAADNASAE